MSRPVILAPLAPAVHADLLQRFNTTSDPESRTRYQMVLLATERQLSPTEIAGLVFRSHDTVWRVLRRFQEQGLDAVPRRHGGGPAPTLTPAAEEALLAVIEDDPHDHGVPSANWTTSSLAAYVARTLDIHVSLETVRLALHRRGYVCKRPRWTVHHKAQEREDWEGNASG